LARVPPPVRQTTLLAGLNKTSKTKYHNNFKTLTLTLTNDPHISADAADCWHNFVTYTHRRPVFPNSAIYLKKQF